MVAPIKKELKWLIFGANGQLGKAIQKRLTLLNIENLPMGHSQVDITDKEAISSLLDRELPDVVLNSAAWTNVDLAEEEEDKAYLVNAIGPEIIALECAKIGAKFVHISTDYVFSGETTKPWKESHAPSPVSAYGRTKAEGELLVLKANTPGSYIIRTAWLYGEWGNNFVKTMLRLAKEEYRTVEVVSDQIGQPTYVVDLASQIHRMIEEGATPGIYHGTNTGEATWYEFAKEIFRLVGADPTRVRPIDSIHYPRPANRPAYSVLGHQRWLEEGIEPMRNWKDALRAALPSIIHQVELEG